MSSSPKSMRKREKIDPFSLSFLDIISCGFGAVVVLVLIFRFDPLPKETTAPKQQTDNAAAFNQILAEANIFKKIEQAQSTLPSLASALEASEIGSQTLKKQLGELRQQLDASRAINERKKQQLNNLQNQIKRGKTVGVGVEKTAETDTETGGILVDRDYVIFIVDTSGSMREIWRRVADRLTQILSQHPQVKGIQVMNDNGSYLVSGYAKRWIADTPRMRKRILRLFKLWSSTSNSSPVEGLVRALTDFQTSTENMSIYVLGDDYSGSDFDGVINTVRSLNKGGARINAINFINPSATTDRFSILMREIALENDGTLITM